MKLTKTFWKHFELDIQEIRISFLIGQLVMLKNRSLNIDTCFDGTIKIVSVSSIAGMAELSSLVLLGLESETFPDQNLMASHED